MGETGHPTSEGAAGFRRPFRSGVRLARGEVEALEACDAARPFSIWDSLLGGVGSVQGDGNSSTFTYIVGGAAVGIDYRLTPSVMIDLSAACTNGAQWVDSFQARVGRTR
jgi:uncharacterized protein with beta-barrel porin domain